MGSIAELFTNFGVTWDKLAYQLVTFAVLLVGLRFILYKPMLAMLEERKRRVAQGLQDAEDAAKAKAESEAAAAERLREATRKAEALIEETSQAAQRLKADLTAQTQEELLRLRTAQEQQLAQAQQEMMHQVRSDVAALVVATTEKVLRHSLSAEDKKNLATQAAKELE